MGVGNLPCTSQSLQGRPIATRSRCPWSGGDPSVVSLLPSHPCCSCHPECPIHPVSPTVPWWPRLLFCCEMPTRDQFSSRWRGRVDETLTTTVPRRLVRLGPSKNYVLKIPKSVSLSKHISWAFNPIWDLGPSSPRNRQKTDWISLKDKKHHNYLYRSPPPAPSLK